MSAAMLADAYVQESDSDSMYKLNENHTQYYKQLPYLLIDILIYTATRGTRTPCSRVKSTYHKSIIFCQDVERPTDEIEKSRKKSSLSLSIFLLLTPVINVL